MTVCGQDDDILCIQLSRSSSGVSGVAETPRFQACTAHKEHRVLSLPPDDRPNVPPLPDPKPVIWLVSMGLGLFRNVSLAALTLMMDRPRGSGCLTSYPLRLLLCRWWTLPPTGDSTLGTLSQDKSPQSESKLTVERPSSCDTGHNAQLATKESVQ